MELLETHYQIGNFIDTFAPGHYARVLLAEDIRDSKQIAFKVMRGEHLKATGEPSLEAEAFIREAEFLLKLQDLPEVVNLVDCGYIESLDKHPAGGAILSCGTDVAAFREAFYPSLRKQWRPYLSLDYLPREQNLFYVEKTNTSHNRRRLPEEEAIDLAWQFGNVLKIAHQRGIAYLDHKPEHVYWNGQRLKIIDWNSSRRLGANPGAEIANDIHHLCVGILYPAVTGLSPVKGSLRPQPGSQQEVDNRYSGIQDLQFDEHVSERFKMLLTAGAGKEFASIDDFLAKLQFAANVLGWNFDGQAGESLIQARKNMREGLTRLRESQDAARLAREYLLEAAAFYETTKAIDEELHRLLILIGEYLNARVIP